MLERAGRPGEIEAAEIGRDPVHVDGSQGDKTGGVAGAAQSVLIQLFSGHCEVAGIDPSALPRRCRVQISRDDFASEAREYRCQRISPYSESQASRSGTKDSPLMKSFDYESPLPDLTVEGSGCSGALDIPRGPDLVRPSSGEALSRYSLRCRGRRPVGVGRTSHDRTNGPESARQRPVRREAIRGATIGLKTAR